MRKQWPCVHQGLAQDHTQTHMAEARSLGNVLSTGNLGAKLRGEVTTGSAMAPSGGWPMISALPRGWGRWSMGGWEEGGIFSSPPRHSFWLWLSLWSPPLIPAHRGVILVLPVVRVPGRERRLLETMQLAIGEFITDSGQGLSPSPRVWGWKGPEPQFSQVFIGYNY